MRDSRGQVITCEPLNQSEEHDVVQINPNKQVLKVFTADSSSLCQTVNNWYIMFLTFLTSVSPVQVNHLSVISSEIL